MSESMASALTAIARDAADVINEVYRSSFAVDYKGPNDPVTEADRRANELICQRLHAAYPDVPVVAEESDPSRFADFRSAQRVFFVDPVDGTREFVARNGEFVVMIGLLDGDRAVAGVIHSPTTSVSWVGVVGGGAWQIDENGARTPLHVSTVSSVGDARLVVSRSHRSEVLEQAAQFLQAREIVSMGSAGLKGAYVANGRAEAYVSPSYAGKRWDACAADALVTAAGGTCTDAEGHPIDYRGPTLSNDKGLVASNGVLHHLLLERLARARSQAAT